MITEAQIQRINELARKSKTPEGLTEAEKEEQQQILLSFFVFLYKITCLLPLPLFFVDKLNIVKLGTQVSLKGFDVLLARLIRLHRQE